MCKSLFLAYDLDGMLLLAVHFLKVYLLVLPQATFLYLLQLMDEGTI